MTKQQTVFVKSIIPLLALLLMVTMVSLAQSTTHTVKKGETLFSIAQKYGVEIPQLKKWNDITAENLSVGQSLVIRSTNTDNKDKTTHTVEEQETLFSISKSYNVSIAEIKSWNDLSSNNLSVGQKLVIYPSKEQGNIQQSIVAEDNTQQNTYYTVKSGDSLYRIAQAHNMTITELKELNDLSSNTIRIGQKLTVRGQGDDTTPSIASKANSSPQGKFISHEISGSSQPLDVLLKKFQMTETEFRALNPGVEGTTLYPGQNLTVLAPPSKKYQNPYLNDSNMQSLGTTPVSKYSEKEKATPTTNGELYNPAALTAAHSNISLGSVVYIENPNNNKGVFVRINDRNSGNTLKLSSTAWQLLEFSSSEPTVTIYQN
ncbi:LysM peptidoglycan-binding domain-containing protein [Fodinibius saliphilus]|uniref:LysM peptidoglycan-binding domain-containing protein n=1 Tax=Fodinibius saliphilus TaxID=1920650 RepID=UPI00110A014D|nr:LysM peptidoglycan-binding domain-containing protein [Fodinibius saliphilus]